MGMKERGNWERYSGSYSLESGEYWPFVVPTNISRRLKNATPKGAVVVDWDIAKDTLRSELDPEVDLDDDDVLDDVLNANGWEVLSCTPSHLPVSIWFLPFCVIFSELIHLLPFTCFSLLRAVSMDLKRPSFSP